MVALSYLCKFERYFFKYAFACALFKLLFILIKYKIKMRGITENLAYQRIVF